MSFRQRLVLLAALLALSGCNTANSTIGSGDPRFGEAGKYNAAVQIINPDPVYSHDAQPGDSGVKAAAATKRYRTDAVKSVEEIKTTRSATGGGSQR